MRILKVLFITIIFSANLCYANSDICEGSQTLVDKLVPAISNCIDKTPKCSIEKLKNFHESLSDLVEIIDKSKAEPTENCIRIIEALEVLNKYYKKDEER